MSFFIIILLFFILISTCPLYINLQAKSLNWCFIFILFNFSCLVFYFPLFHFDHFRIPRCFFFCLLPSGLIASSHLKNPKSFYCLTVMALQYFFLLDRSRSAFPQNSLWVFFNIYLVYILFNLKVESPFLVYNDIFLKTDWIFNHHQEFLGIVPFGFSVVPWKRYTVKTMPNIPPFYLVF